MANALVFRNVNVIQAILESTVSIISIA